MKILATVKRVTDYEAKLTIAPQGTAVELNGVNMIMNPFDEIGVEEAIRIKEKHGGEVAIVSIGPIDASQQIRAALAKGADRGIHVVTDKNLDCLQIAQVLSQIAKEEKPDIVMMGKQAIDDDSHQVAEMLAELLDCGQATQANTVTIDGPKVRVVREADGGLETVDVDMPCVITSDLRLNEPRFASLPGIMAAKRKPLAERKLDDFTVSPSSVMVTKLELPPKKSGGQMVPDVATLVAKLKNEAKVL